jgi:hypothetical protein
MLDPPSSSLDPPSSLRADVCEQWSTQVPLYVHLFSTVRCLGDVELSDLAYIRVFGEL